MISAPLTEADLKRLPYRTPWRAIEEALRVGDYEGVVYYFEHSHGARTLRRLIELAETPGPPQHLALRAVGWRLRMAGYGFFRDLFARSDLSDEMREVATDVCCGGLDYDYEDHPDYDEAVDMVAAHLEHPFADVRFSACLTLGRTHATRMIPRIEPLLEDKAWSQFGRVAKMADLAIRSIQGEDVDLHHAFDRRGAAKALRSPRSALG